MIVAGAHTMTIDRIENVIASKTMEIMAIFFLHPTAALYLNTTSGNSITTSNIYTVQGPRGRDGRDGVPGRDGRDGTQGERGDTVILSAG